MTVEYAFIDTDKALGEFCRALAADALVAIDTEFVGEKTYWADLELVQIRGENGAVGLVDARGIRDPKPLADVLLDPAREKILHSGTQDIQILHRWLGGAIEPLFDTQIAAAMAGDGAQMSYANLVSRYCGATLAKDHTVSDWSRRPLSRAQLDYAAEDVVHLHELREKLLKTLQSLEREPWFRDEQQSRVREILAGCSEETPDDELYMEVKEWGKLKGRHLAILQRLAAWRERKARALNEPRRKLMPDQALITLARLAPSTREEIRSARQLPQGPANRFIDDVLAVVAEAKKIPKEQWPKREATQYPDIPAGVVELLQALVRTVAEEERIAPTLLTTSAELNSLVNHRRRLDEAEFPVLQGWRRQLVGERLLALLDGRLVVRIEKQDRMVFEERT